MGGEEARSSERETQILGPEPSDNSTNIAPQPPSALSPADAPTPVLLPQRELPALGNEATVQPVPPLEAPTEPQAASASPRVIEFFRTGEGAFVTANRSTVARQVSQTVSIHSVDEALKRHRAEMSKSDTANIGVNEAFRTRGEEARKVIVSELKQMLDKRVWMPVMGGKLTAMQRSATIRSSMFLKRKNNPETQGQASSWG